METGKYGRAQIRRTRGRLWAGQRAALPAPAPGSPMGFGGARWGAMPVAPALAPWASQPVGKMNTTVGMASQAAAASRQPRCGKVWERPPEDSEQPRFVHSWPSVLEMLLASIKIPKDFTITGRCIAKNNDNYYRLSSLVVSSYLLISRWRVLGPGRLRHVKGSSLGVV